VDLWGKFTEPNLSHTEQLIRLMGFCRILHKQNLRVGILAYFLSLLEDHSGQESY